VKVVAILCLALVYLVGLASPTPVFAQEFETVVNQRAEFWRPPPRDRRLSGGVCFRRVCAHPRRCVGGPGRELRCQPCRQWTLIRRSCRWGAAPSVSIQAAVTGVAEVVAPAAC